MSDNIRREFLRINGWIDFTESIRNFKDREKYDKVWELIKLKNNW